MLLVVEGPAFPQSQHRRLVRRNSERIVPRPGAQAVYDVVGLEHLSTPGPACGELHRTAQLAYVTWPGVLHERVHRAGGDVDGSGTGQLAALLQHAPANHGNVLGSFTHGR